MSIALQPAGILISMLWHGRRGKKMWTAALLGAAVGVLLTVLVFWLIDLHNPIANHFSSIIGASRSAWGLAVDDDDGALERLLFGWTARQIRSHIFADVANVVPEQAADYWRNLRLGLGWSLVWLVPAGFIKIHLGSSMHLADDPDGDLDAELSARRAARLACVAETFGHG